MKQDGNRVAIVTGASRGIGRAVAEAFAREGISVVLGYHQRDDEMKEVIDMCRSSGVDAFSVRGDIGAEGTAEELTDTALDRFGRVDVLVNNAGVAVEELTAILNDVDLARMIQTNITGLVRISRAVLRPMLRQRSGSIVNLSSVLATHSGQGNAVYAGTKGFVESFTRSLAAEVARKGIRVNAVAPGVIETDMSRAVRALAENRIKQRVAERRYGAPEDVANVICSLIRKEASYVNGAVIPVDGAYC